MGLKVQHPLRGIPCPSGRSEPAAPPMPGMGPESGEMKIVASETYDMMFKSLLKAENEGDITREIEKVYPMVRCTGSGLLSLLGIVYSSPHRERDPEHPLTREISY